MDLCFFCYQNTQGVFTVQDITPEIIGQQLDAIFDDIEVDARLPNGSRVNAIIPPLAIDGPSITIRKFQEVLEVERLLH